MLYCYHSTSPVYPTHLNPITPHSHTHTHYSPWYLLLSLPWRPSSDCLCGRNLKKQKKDSPTLGITSSHIHKHINNNIHICRLGKHNAHTNSQTHTMMQFKDYSEDHNNDREQSWTYWSPHLHPVTARLLGNHTSLPGHLQFICHTGWQRGLVARRGECVSVRLCLCWREQMILLQDILCSATQCFCYWKGSLDSILCHYAPTPGAKWLLFNRDTCQQNVIQFNSPTNCIFKNDQSCTLLSKDRIYFGLVLTCVHLLNKLTAIVSVHSEPAMSDLHTDWTQYVQLQILVHKWQRNILK